MPGQEPYDVVEVTVRRVPRFGVFMGIGAALGVLIAGILALTGNQEPSTALNVTYPVGQVFGFLLLWTAPAGIALGGLVALVLERIVRRRQYVLQAEHTIAVDDVEPATATSDDASEGMLGVSGIASGVPGVAPKTPSGDDSGTATNEG